MVSSMKNFCNEAAKILGVVTASQVIGFGTSFATAAVLQATNPSNRDLWHLMPVTGMVAAGVTCTLLNHSFTKVAIPGLNAQASSMSKTISFVLSAAVMAFPLGAFVDHCVQRPCNMAYGSFMLGMAYLGTAMTAIAFVQSVQLFDDELKEAYAQTTRPAVAASGVAVEANFNLRSGVRFWENQSRISAAAAARVYRRNPA